MKQLLKMVLISGAFFVCIALRAENKSHEPESATISDETANKPIKQTLKEIDTQTADRINAIISANKVTKFSFLQPNDIIEINKLISSNPAVYDFIVDKLNKSEDKLIIKCIILILGALDVPYSKIATTVINFIKYPEWEVRQAVVETLASREQGVDQLVYVLNYDQDARVLNSAAYALRRIGDSHPSLMTPEVITALIGHLKGKETIDYKQIAVGRTSYAYNLGYIIEDNLSLLTPEIIESLITVAKTDPVERVRISTITGALGPIAMAIRTNPELLQLAPASLQTEYVTLSTALEKIADDSNESKKVRKIAKQIFSNLVFARQRPLDKKKPNRIYRRSKRGAKGGSSGRSKW